MPSDTTVQSPYRRLGDKVKAAFDLAYNQRDLEVAEHLFKCLELLTIQHAGAASAEHEAQLAVLGEAQQHLAELRRA